MKGDLHRRFQQENFLLVKNIEALLIDSANCNTVSLSPKLKEMYSSDIDMEKLSIHLQMLPDVVKAVHLDDIAIRKVTGVHTLCDILNHQSSLKHILIEVHKLLKIYLTIPVTTSSTERSFSALKRIKKYLRNAMTQERLNHCMLLHMHREKNTDNLNLIEIAQEYVVSRCEKKTNFFWKFGEYCTLNALLL